MVKSTTLQNGVRVVVKSMEGLLSVTMGILVGTGAAYETEKEDGISHFIEHMQFKGTDTRTAFEISDAFDALGAQVNAFTGKDVTCYYAKSTSDHAGEAFTLLADLFLNSTFPEEEMEREKGVVVEEINMDEDTPDDLCLDLLSRASFGSENYGRNILGPAKNVKGFTRALLPAEYRHFLCREYRDRRGGRACDPLLRRNGVQELRAERKKGRLAWQESVPQKVHRTGALCIRLSHRRARS